MSKRSSFQEEVERLEAIVRQLEDEDVDLDRALVLFEDGVKRLKSARALLAEAEVTVKRVIAEADGTVAEEPLDL